MNPWQRTQDWFWRPQSIAPMVCNRIILGLVLFLCYCGRSASFSLLYAPGSIGWYPPYRILVNSYVNLPLNPIYLKLASWNSDYLFVFLLGMYGLLLLSSLAFAFGYRTRTSGCVALLLHLFFFNLNPNSYWGWARMIQPFFLYTILSPCGRQLSIDARRLARVSAESVKNWLAPAWPVRLVQIHVCTMYFVAGVSRLDHQGWLQGQMLSVALTNTAFSRFAFDWQAWDVPFRVLSYLVFVLEPVAPILLWTKRFGTWIAVSLIAMHIGLEILTNVGWWNYIMIAALTAFLPARWLAQLLRRPEAAMRPTPALSAQV